jgi:hypothetical protein
LVFEPVTSINRPAFDRPSPALLPVARRVRQALRKRLDEGLGLQKQAHDRAQDAGNATDPSRDSGRTRGPGPKGKSGDEPRRAGSGDR